MAERKEPTEPIPAGERRGSTEPLESAPGPDDARQRRLWLIAGILALVLMFFVGFLVGREQGSAPAGPQTQDLERLRGPRLACARALRVADRANRLLQRAVANRGAFTQATVGGDEETVSQLQKEFESVSNQYDRVEARLERLTDRCRGGAT
jgi:hypothetical protein